MAHRGIRQYAGDETGNVGLGQLGFKALAAGGSVEGNFWMIKVIGGVADQAVTLALECHQGDDITLTGVVTGELVYGAFKKITTSGYGTNVVVLCYHGSPI